MYYLFSLIKCIPSIYIFMKNMGGMKNKIVLVLYQKCCNYFTTYGFNNPNYYAQYYHWQ